MKLTNKSDYCLRVLIYLQKHKRKVKIKEIANYHNISKNHLSVAVNRLSELGYVHTTPGPSGGITFNEDFKYKTVKDLIVKTEDFFLVECFDIDNNQCVLSPSCKLRKAISKATEAFLNELKKTKIKDLR